MNKVEPIRNTEKIEEMKKQLQNNHRNYILFLLGINCGLRVSDLLKLKVKDIKNSSHIRLREKKTNKYKKHFLNDSLKEKLNGYIVKENLKNEDYIFQSREGENEPISRIQAYRILNKAAAKIGLEKIGTHSLRKTFGYHHYQKHKDIATLQLIFNHSNPATTLEYIGINQDMIDNSVKNFLL